MLYEIPNNLSELLALYNSEECAEQDREALEIKMQELCEFEDFIKYLCEYAAEKEADAAYFEPMFKRLKDKISAAKVSSENTWQFIEKLLANRKIDKMRAGEFDLSFRKSTQTIIIDPNMISDDYVKIVREPKKTEIKKAIQSGVIIDGAYLKEVKNLQVK